MAALFAAESDTAVGAAIQAGEHVADRWGLWPVLSLALVAMLMYFLWKQTQFVQGQFLEIMTDQIRTNRQVRDAIKGAPCGLQIPDSDQTDDAEITPTPKQLATIARQRRRAADRNGVSEQ